MARPQDIERAEKFMRLRESSKSEAEARASEPPNPGSIFTTKARALQRARVNALVGIRHGDREPLGTYRDQLGIYKAFLHLGNHMMQYDAAALMLAEVGADRTPEEIADALVRHEDAIDALRRGALGL